MSLTSLCCNDTSLYFRKCKSCIVAGNDKVTIEYQFHSASERYPIHRGDYGLGHGAPRKRPKPVDSLSIARQMVDAAELSGPSYKQSQPRSVLAQSAEQITHAFRSAPAQNAWPWPVIIATLDNRERTFANEDLQYEP
jgi:hypothetical protein